MKTYSYEKSQALFDRATKVIPAGIYGHLGPSSGCFIPVSAYPFYVERAEGAYMWDLDGNRFIDYMCAYGPIVLGYNHPEVNRAAMAQLEKGDCTCLPSVKMVELAELLVDTVHSADWAFFAKNGGDVTNLAMMTARAATGRKEMLKFRGGYHGVSPWMQSLGYPGVIEEDVANVLVCEFNDIEGFRKTVQEHQGEIAGVIASPYHHPAFEDNALPVEGFWQEVRQLCTEDNIVLIVDDIRAGFRLNTKGSDFHYGFEADLICFCKALANGYNISALCGKETLKSYASAVFYTGSYWLSSMPMAAALKTIELLRNMDGAKVMTELGRTLTQGLVTAGKEHGFDLVISGEPAMWYMRLNNDPTGILHQEFVAECVRRGAFFTSHHNMFINTAMTQDDLSHTIDIAHEAYQAVRKNHPELG